MRPAVSESLSVWFDGAITVIKATIIGFCLLKCSFCSDKMFEQRSEFNSGQSVKE